MKINEIVGAAYPEGEKFYGIIPEIKYVPTDALTPYEDLKSQWRTIKSVMTDSNLTQEQWATWWLKGNPHPAEIYWENDGLVINDGHHRYIAAKILNVPLRVTVKAFYVPGWDINEFIESNNAALKQYGRKYLK